MRPKYLVALFGIGLAAGVLLSAPNAAVAQGRAPGPFAAFAPDCEIAAVDKEHLFLATGVNQGDTLTNILLGAEGLTTTIRVAVRESKKPVTLLLQAETPVIWDFEEAGDQIRRVIVIAPDRERAAVRGLAAAKVEFFKMTRCPEQSIPIKLGAGKSDPILRQLFGRAPDFGAYEYRANALTVPDLKFIQSRTDGPERTAETAGEKALLNFYPGGFRLFDKASLVSPVEVSIPETYPAEAGLVQLERSGAIRRPGAEELAAFSEGFSKPFRSRADPNYLARSHFHYAVTRDVMLPAGLYGAHSKSFLVLAGVPQPRGNAGHGCLAFMDGFRTNEGATCHSEMREALQRLKDLPADTPSACRMIDVPADASVEAVSIYEPKGARHSGNSKRNAEPVDLRVSKPGDVLLVLNSYEPAIWRVAAGDATRIVGVVLVGYYASRVEGIDPKTPIVVADHEGRNSRVRPEAACEWAHRFNGTSFRGGPSALVLGRQVEVLTGRTLDGLRGGYALNSVEIH